MQKGQKETTIKIMPDGTAFFIYDENVQIDGARLEMRRASTVDFDEQEQKWFVTIHQQDKPVRLETGFSKRSDAIDYEVQMLTAMLDLGAINPSVFFQLIEKGPLGGGITRGPFLLAPVRKPNTGE